MTEQSPSVPIYLRSETITGSTLAMRRVVVGDDHLLEGEQRRAAE